jgi:hypothetical protein
MDIVEKSKKFIKKIQELKEENKKRVLWVAVSILAIIMICFWAKTTLQRLSYLGESVKNSLPSVSINTQIPTSETEKTDNWQTYTNGDYKLEIKYPAGWTFRDYNSGAAFFPKDKSTENETGNGYINIGFYKRGANYCKIPFDDYVKIAGPSEIQNYESLNTGEVGINDNGLEFYKITWNYSDFRGNKKISSPITYFETSDDLCGSIEISLNDENYSDIYNKIISTFKFAK